MGWYTLCTSLLPQIIIVGQRRLLCQSRLRVNATLSLLLNRFLIRLLPTLLLSFQLYIICVDALPSPTHRAVILIQLILALANFGTKSNPVIDILLSE